MSVTEGFFARIDAQVARLARATAEERKMPLRELVEKALRMYINELTEPERRAAALHAMEEALLGRLDRRLGQHLERVSGLYAREAFDLAQTLDLVKRILWHTVRDREMMTTYLNESRTEATKTLQQRAAIPAGGDATEAVKKAQEVGQKWQARAQQLEKENTRLHEVNGQLQEEKARLIHERQQAVDQARMIQERFGWAVQQFEAQRGFSKRPLGDFLRQWDQEH